MENVKVVSDDSLMHAGFSSEQIEKAKTDPDAFVGEINGVKYYRAQNELNIDLGQHKTRSVEMPRQQGDFQ